MFASDILIKSLRIIGHALRGAVYDAVARIASRARGWKSLCAEGAACLHAEGLLLEVAEISVCITVVRVNGEMYDTTCADKM